MAEETKDDIDISEEAGKSKKMLIIIAAAVLLLGGGGAAFFLMGGEEEATEEVAEAPPVKQAAIYHAVETPCFPSNWELSAARAASVVHLLDRYGLNPSRMSAIGYGEFKPIADNANEEGRKKNRRVVLVVLGSDESRRSLDVFSNSPILTN